MNSIEGMAPFFSLLGDLAWKETRSIQLLQPQGNLLPGQYGLLELYCMDRKCDCRRVILHVVSEDHPGKVLAAINFGWESVQFYTRWMRGDKKAGRDIANASLDPLNPQSPYSSALLDLVQASVLSDPDYVERLERHYWMFKKALSKNPAR